MQAVVIERSGGPEVLEIRDVPAPVPGPGELLVRVRASGVNPLEAKIRQDPASRGISLPAILGYEASGVVEALGPGTTGWAVGDEVFYRADFLGNRQGTHAELHPVAASLVARKPRGLSFAEAAGIPLAGGTAWEAVVRRLAIRPGETILIYGGAGGVGSYAIPFAKAAGARVLAVASRANLPYLRERGADLAIDYGASDPVAVALEATDGRGVDALLDLVGGATLTQAVGAVRPFGRCAVIVGFHGDFPTMYRRNLTLHTILLHGDRRRLEELTPLFESGAVRVPVTTASFDEIRSIHRRFDSGHGRGKTVLTVG